MKERPILFSAPMVRAILAGTKTQTRRVVKPQPGDGFKSFGEMPTCACDDFYGFHDGKRHYRCPYGAPGDQLWVRETWQRVPPKAGAEHCPFGLDDNDQRAARYRATWDRSHSIGWRPSIHMPRWASRITLQVTGVRVERLQAISEEDAKAEGIHEFRLPNGSIFGVQGVKGTDVGASAREAFAILWDQINAKRAPWSANPWVWVIEFRRVQA